LSRGSGSFESRLVVGDCVLLCSLFSFVLFSCRGAVGGVGDYNTAVVYKKLSLAPGEAKRFLPRALDILMSRGPSRLENKARCVEGVIVLVLDKPRGAPSDRI
jgi:hypothetical protein